MSDLEEHCKRTLKRYGVEGRDIHSWFDEPSREYAGAHRQFRHDTETVRMVGEIFGKIYGKSLAENIALDHIMLDHEEATDISCSYCNTLLRPSYQFCPECGAPRTKIIEEFDRAFEMEKLKLQEKKKSLQRELKLELALKELTTEERVYLWKKSSIGDYDFFLKLYSSLYVYIEDFLVLKMPSNDQKDDLNKLGLSKPFGKVVLDRLVQKDFEEHPDIKEKVYKEIEWYKSERQRLKEIREEGENKKKTRFNFIFKRQSSD